MNSYGIHWFRRDLRLEHNKAFLNNSKLNNGYCLGLFCFDSHFLSRSDFSHNRFKFFLKALEVLQEQLRFLGSDLLIVDLLPQKAFYELVSQKNGTTITQISWNEDYEPFARKRDKEVRKILEEHNVKVVIERDHVVFRPWEIGKPSINEPYKMFSPFKKKWLEMFSSPKLQEERAFFADNSLDLKNLNLNVTLNAKWKDLPFGKKHFDALELFQEKTKQTIPIPAAGFSAAFSVLESFCLKHLSSYSEQRNTLSFQEGTSGLSLYFKSGQITPSLVLGYLRKNNLLALESSQIFISEIIWREFFYHILFHFPSVELESFRQDYKRLEWNENKEWFERWCKGLTGFPVVDATMRQLQLTGKMHNRARMITASFLIKDLGINWQWGEKFFMETLLDGDLAPNNGNWQWVASTGHDSAPYFRIFNPWTQSEKFDPLGLYIRQYLPELNELENKELHRPIINHSTYPRPMVSHDIMRQETLKRYKKVSNER